MFRDVTPAPTQLDRKFEVKCKCRPATFYPMSPIAVKFGTTVAKFGARLARVGEVRLGLVLIRLALLKIVAHSEELVEASHVSSNLARLGQRWAEIGRIGETQTERGYVQRLSEQQLVPILFMLSHRLMLETVAQRCCFEYRRPVLKASGWHRLRRHGREISPPFRRATLT